MKKIIFYIGFSISMISLFFFACANQKQTFTTEGEPAKTAEAAERTYSRLAQELLQAIRNNKPTKSIEKKLTTADAIQLHNELNTDAKKMAFWVNIYNGFIQLVLNENPKLYDDRNAFFKKEQINIAGYKISFDKIEHGLIRSSTWKLSKGYLPKVFPGDFERYFRLDNRDARIHFVLNCGAKDCPPVYIFDAATLNDDFDKVAGAYLQNKTEFNADKKVVKTTPLFQWFTGDFGVGKKGVKETLARYNIIPEDHGDIDVKYNSYDWTLDLGNFGEQSLTYK